MKKHSPIKVLFFANIPVSKDKRSVGGATILAKNILKYLKQKTEITITHKQIRHHWTPRVQFLEYILLVFTFPFKIQKFDVISIHGTRDVHITIGPILYLYSKLFNKKVVYHFFAGDFHEWYARSGKIGKWIFDKTILKSDTVFFETKELISFFDHKVNHAVWLPNARKSPEFKILSKPYQKKFVFVSRIIPDKGIPEILEVFSRLDSTYSIDIYGPIDDRYYNSSLFLNTPNTHYKGLLASDQVVEVLNQNDVLILPTYAHGEGYPGIIIEALSVGLPVITTNFRTIPEIVQNDYNGKLIPIKDVDALENAILFFNETNYKIYSRCAKESFEQFEAEKVFDKILKSYIS